MKQSWIPGGAFGVFVVLLTCFFISQRTDLSSQPGSAAQSSSAAPDAEWTHYGHDLTGSKYSSLDTINTGNLSRLKPAWVFSTGTVQRQKANPKLQVAKYAYEVTPIKVDQKLYLCDPFNVVFALDAATGKQIWSYDPQIDGLAANGYVCRGVSYWKDPDANPRSVCAKEILFGTMDGRLIALDADTGKTCPDFGRDGQISLREGLGDLLPGEYWSSSPPTIVRDLVITGGSVTDNWRKDAPSGVIRAFDVRTGKLKWAWNPVPPGYQRPAGESGDYERGTPNAWFTFSADEENDMIFIPTGNPALDLYGGDRGNLDYYGSSVVALRATTGKYLWHFQTVHHDLWDYDVDSQPVLFNLRKGDEVIPALAQATKVGHVFILNRLTGKPIFPVTEKPVPQSDVEGEKTSPTQPFPSAPQPLYADRLDLFSNPLHSYGCIGAARGARFEGVFTPPSLKGSIQFPGPLGGTEWGGAAVDPKNQVLVLSQNHLPVFVKLMPKSAPGYKQPPTGVGIPLQYNFPMMGSPYGATRTPVPAFGLAFFGQNIPCSGNPLGEIIAINLTDGSIRWRHPFGSMFHVTNGAPNTGGPLVTAGGIVFVGAALDAKFRAFDVNSGNQLWEFRLPVPAVATPMTYSVNGEQYIVVAAGGHDAMKTSLDDKIYAFKLQ